MLLYSIHTIEDLQIHSRLISFRIIIRLIQNGLNFSQFCYHHFNVLLVYINLMFCCLGDIVLQFILNSQFQSYTINFILRNLIRNILQFIHYNQQIINQMYDFENVCAHLLNSEQPNIFQGHPNVQTKHAQQRWHVLSANPTVAIPQQTWLHRSHTVWHWWGNSERNSLPICKTLAVLCWERDPLIWLPKIIMDSLSCFIDFTFIYLHRFPVLRYFWRQIALKSSIWLSLMWTALNEFQPEPNPDNRHPHKI